MVIDPTRYAKIKEDLWNELSKGEKIIQKQPHAINVFSLSF